MPGPKREAPDGAPLIDPMYTAATTGTNNTSQLRPRTSGCSAGTRSPSPLFARWVRWQRKEADHLNQDELRTSTDKRSTSSSTGPSKLLAQTQSDRNDTRQHGHGNHIHTHTYNFSTSTTSSNHRSQSPLPPPLTREEFEALPVAIQRKYFSTLERLRFAQASDIDDISQHYDQISAHNFKRRKACQDRSASTNCLRPRRRSLLESHFSSADSLAFAGLSDEIRKKHFTPEQQSALARTSAILDAADEAVHRAGGRVAEQLDTSPLTDTDVEPATPSLQSGRDSMDSHGTGPQILEENKGTTNVPGTFYDSFRWLDEDEDLDLRLSLDDYHASLNLRENVPAPSKQRRPSFRRQLSISKIPFGRLSLASSRPATQDAVGSPMLPLQSPSSSTSEFHFGHTRRKSRALSLITPKHAGNDLITAIDPSAAHYQDPEARLKLRVYLASPQKFDEAIEFGFPSFDSPGADGPSHRPNRRQSRQHLSDGSNLRSFLADFDDADDDDDKLSLTTGQHSVADPESPQTPQTLEKPITRPLPFRAASEPPAHAHMRNASECSYTMDSAGSREMTLRMTLTRPDLRAHEEQIYGWQQGVMRQTGKKPQQYSHLRDNSITNISQVAETAAPRGNSKESMDKVFAEIDQSVNYAPNNNVMKRIWNRVRRS